MMLDSKSITKLNIIEQSLSFNGLKDFLDIQQKNLNKKVEVFFNNLKIKLSTKM